jgi:hypothetical protein
MAIGGWRTVHGDPIADDGLIELQGHVQSNLARIAADPVSYSRGASTIAVTWWHSGHPTRFAPAGVAVEVASRDFAEYLDGALLVLLLRGDERRVRQCRACSTFWLAGRSDAKGVECPGEACRKARAAASRRKARRDHARRFRKATRSRPPERCHPARLHFPSNSYPLSYSARGGRSVDNARREGPITPVRSPPGRVHPAYRPRVRPARWTCESRGARFPVGVRSRSGHRPRRAWILLPGARCGAAQAVARCGPSGRDPSVRPAGAPNGELETARARKSSRRVAQTGTRFRRRPPTPDNVASMRFSGIASPQGGECV